MIKHYTEEQRHQMSEILKNSPRAIEQRKKLHAYNKGRICIAQHRKHFSDETRKKLSDQKKGKPSNNKWTEESRRKIGQKSKERKVSLETRRKIREKLTGAKCYAWKGGRTTLQKLIRRSFEYRQWRSDVFTRDDFTCQGCGVRGGELNADHKKAFSLILLDNQITTFEQSLKCEELWNINNGRTLCKDCHKKTANYAGKIHGRKNAMAVVTIGG